MRTLHGIAAAPGLAMGQAQILAGRGEKTVDRREISPDDVESERQRFREALELCRAELQSLRAEASSRLEPAATEVFTAQLLILEDPVLVEQVQERINQELRSAAALVEEVMEAFSERIASLDSLYLRERVQDIRDVQHRLLRALRREPSGAPPDFGTVEGRIVVARELSPSDIVALSRSGVVGFVSGTGGRTSHVAILASGLGLPAVVGLGEAWTEIAPGELLIVDGDQGKVIVNPDQATVSKTQRALACRAKSRESRRSLRFLPGQTADGVRVKLKANISSTEDVTLALANGAEGVGLLRTEFLFLSRLEAPGEEEQFETYREIGKAFGSEQVVIRTLDVGGDKALPFLSIPREENPFLGLRGLRLLLVQPQLFLGQLRAILRAAAFANLAVMLPMVTTLAELRQTKNLLVQAKEELRSEGKRFASDLRLGIMVETPAAALMAKYFAPEVDFFSLGTNDLTQYTLAVDRTNDAVAGLYEEAHPAVVRLIKAVVKAGEQFKKPVSVCGRLAGDPQGAQLLVGLGVRELSVDPGSLPEVKESILSLTVEAAEELAQRRIDPQG
ncbi:MAG: phosphoenolpyruvate--protein phosphotransferase [Bacillota bacterium]